eukprot:752110-Hanusia_phi.AAC.13
MLRLRSATFLPASLLSPPPHLSLHFFLLLSPYLIFHSRHPILSFLVFHTSPRYLGFSTSCPCATSPRPSLRSSLPSSASAAHIMLLVRAMAEEAGADKDIVQVKLPGVAGSISQLVKENSLAGDREREEERRATREHRCCRQQQTTEAVEQVKEIERLRNQVHLPCPHRSSDRSSPPRSSTSSRRNQRNRREKRRHAVGSDC